MKKIFLLATAVLALAACDKNEDNQLSSNKALQITATIGKNTVSRADDEGWPGDHDNWVQGDSIGIISTVGNVGPFINYKYTTSGNGEFSGKPLFFYKPMVLTAYYPFTGGEGTLPGDEGIIEASTGVENQSEENRPKIDFLWDSKTGADKKDFSAANPNVEFTFAHKMSKLTFQFKSSKPLYDEDDPSVLISDGVDVHTMISYQIEGLGVRGTFNTATGECTIGENGREGLAISCDKEATADGEPDYEYLRKMSPLIVFPQKKPADDDFVLHITTDELSEGSPEQNYKCVLRFTDDEIKPGYHYKFTIMVSRRALIIGNLTIEPWNASEKFMIATIDGDEQAGNQ